jgi:hypothetical protein
LRALIRESTWNCTRTVTMAHKRGAIRVLVLTSLIITEFQKVYLRSP